ncbi:hypothetical protein AN641_00070 [Candidatus Epulonipiscioides gigas]|nr:hypothetical protein AN641_00070 [Epulopiscium sp. SCG-C07WGA-EpuloA2]
MSEKFRNRLLGALAISAVITGFVVNQDPMRVIQIIEVNNENIVTGTTEEVTNAQLEIEAKPEEKEEKEGIESKEEQEIIKVETEPEPVKEVVKEEQKDTATKVPSKPLVEERTINMEIHVFAKEVPWGEAQTADENSFTSIAEAIKDAIPGDTIIVHEGIYREALNITKDNLTIKNFEDDYVLVTGTEAVTGWEDAIDHPTPGVKVATVPEKWKKTTLDFSQVFTNGVMGDMARHPNRTLDSMMSPTEEGSGYSEVKDIFKLENGPGTVTFLTGLPDVDLTGGLFRGLIGKNREYPIGHVVSNEADTLEFDAVNRSHWVDGNEIEPGWYHRFGFATVMHKNLIDKPGEWFIEGDKIYYLPEEGVDVNDLSIEMQVREKVLLISGADNVILDGINFKAGNASIKNTNNLMMQSCSMRYLHPFWLPTNYGDGMTDQTGIYMENSSNNTFKDTHVAHTWGGGFTLMGGKGNTFTNCIIEDIGWIGIFTAGISTKAADTLIEDCTFRDNGRFQIRLRNSNKTDIIHNEFIGAMSMSEDAGAISAESTGQIGPYDIKGSEIAYNKIHDVKGVPVSSGGYLKQFMLGIYLEDIENYTAHHNLIYDIVADNYDTGLDNFLPAGAMLYMGPRYNSMHKSIKFYNNTGWNVDKTINLWNIEIANFEELKADGLKQEDATGLMSNGHFANNIFETGINELNYSAQHLTRTGGTIKSVALPVKKGLITDDLQAFFEHCATVGYMFNPENNFSFDYETGGSNFVNATKGDFRLVETSPAYKGGIPIEGITSSDTPDAGALEGDGRVLTAGSTLKPIDFKEVIK